MTRAQEIAKQLLDIQAVALREYPEKYFTWTSGIKSPIYCDNRITMSFPAVRRMIADGMVEIIKEKYPTVEVIAGTATAGIPHAAWVSERLDLPMLYVRDAAKKHGKTNQIEGFVESGKKVVIIEDLISTGLSSLKVAAALREAGYEVLGVVAIFSYELIKAKDAFEEAGVDYETLTHYSELIEAAVATGYLPAETVEALIEWRDQL